MASVEAREGLLGIERTCVDVAAAVSKDKGIEQQQHRHLPDQGDAQDAGRDVHVEVGQDRDQPDHKQRRPVPRDVISVLGELGRGEVGKAAAERRLEHRVRRDHEQPCRHSQLTPKAVADEAVEPACRGDLAGHRDVADREDTEDQRGERESSRRTDAVAVTDRQRRVEQHGRDRRSAGHGKEENAPEADRASMKLVQVLTLRDIHAFNDWKHRGAVCTFWCIGLKKG